jgi:hypothetical protein
MQSLDNISTPDILNNFVNKIENENIEDSLDILFNKNLDSKNINIQQEIKNRITQYLENNFKSKFKKLSLEFNVKESNFILLFSIFKFLVINYTINYKFVDIEQFRMFTSNYYYFERNIANIDINKVKYLIQICHVGYAQLFNINI